MPKEVEEMEAKSKELLGNLVAGRLYLVSWDNTMNFNGSSSTINKSKYLIFDTTDDDEIIATWKYPSFYASPYTAFCLYIEGITDIKEITDKDELLILSIR